MRRWPSAAYGWLAGGRIGTLHAKVRIDLSVPDSFGQAVNLLHADGTVNARVTFSYDGNGNQLTAQNSLGTYTMAYDAGNEVTSVQGLWGTVLTFSYDAAGNRSVTQDNFGGVTSYTHDANANLTQEQFGGTNQTAMRIDLGYDKNNQLTSETRYSDLGGTTKVATTSMAYDGDGNRLNQLDLNGSGGNIANYTWTYDAADRLTTEKLNGGATVSYTYDNANELTGDGVTSPTYDATGNRSGAGYTVSTGNELTVDPNDTYSYDAAGEETKAVIKSSGNAWVYTYDPKGEVTKAQLLQYDPAIHGTGDPVLQEVDYKYDALGNMVERDYPTGTGSPVTRYALDGWDPALAGATGISNFNVWAELDGNNSNALLTRYFHGDQVDQLFGRQDSLVQYWTLTDRLGSVRDVLDNSGNVKDAINYDGWGNIFSESNNSYRGNYAWTGRQFDVETALQYNRARWYDPATGRWQIPDPLRFAAGDSNLYRYVENNAPDRADPSGSLSIDIEGAPDPALPILKLAVGAIIVNSTPIGGEAGLQGAFVASQADTQKTIPGTLPYKNLPQLAAIFSTKNNKIDHFNWYQTVTITFMGNGAQPFFDGKGNRLGKLFVDPPPGGLHVKDAKGNLLVPKGSEPHDSLPWYYDEQAVQGGSKDNQLTSNYLDKDGGKTKLASAVKLGYTDVPRSVCPATYDFRTWLVGLNKDSAPVYWFKGFSWTWSNKGGAPEITNLKEIQPLTGGDLKKYYTGLIGGFGKP